MLVVHSRILYIPDTQQPMILHSSLTACFITRAPTCCKLADRLTSHREVTSHNASPSLQASINKTLTISTGCESCLLTMSESDGHDGFCRIPLSNELQEILHDFEQSSNRTEPKKVPRQDIDLGELPWGPEKQDVARKILEELVRPLFQSYLLDQLTKKGPHVKNWPGKEDLQKNWEGKDLVLYKGALLTPKNQRDIYIARPFSGCTGAKVVIHNKATGAVKPLEWSESSAFALMLEANVRIAMLRGPPIRFFLLGVKCTQQAE